MEHMPSSKQSFNRNKIAVDYVMELFGEGCVRVGQDAGYNIETSDGLKIRICSAFPRERKTTKTVRFTLTVKSLEASTHLCIVEIDANGNPVDGRIIPILESRRISKVTQLPGGKSFSMSVPYEKVKEMPDIMSFRVKDKKVVYIKEGDADHTHAYVQMAEREPDKTGRISTADFKCMICGKIRTLGIAIN